MEEDVDEEFGSTSEEDGDEEMLFGPIGLE